ncbi:PAS domain-containing sensor histidine kinase [Desulfonatronum thioautotrophicum]|uniref:PAS domain-containing sensor histidine kinase n=1 Tax=Desulfonatronum thioautotrophicum TaxID=617001 RepID=UPI00069B275C|nr:ATP-binding protein [Desulfonatronum thioautotrophicum]
MNTKKEYQKNDQASDLRRQAEDRLASSGKDPDTDVHPDTEARLIHDLRVHQVELELQNEELRETQKHLEAARDSYARLFQQAPVGYLIVQDNGVIIQVNATFCAMLGLSINDVVGKPLSDFLEQEDRGIFLGRFKAFFKNPEGKTMELRMHRYGETFPVRMRARVEDKIPVNPAGQKAIAHGLFLTVSDITEQKRAETALRTAKEQAEVADRTKTDFLMNMSHELRTPLNGLLGMLGLLDQPEMDADQSKLLTMAVNSANRLSRVLTDILDLTEIEAGRVTLNNRPFSTIQLTESVRDLFAPVFQEKGLQLRINTAQDLPNTAIGDDIRIRQVLFNLVGNAFKFTPSGEVAVHVGWEPSDSPKRFMLMLRVTDTGIGMSPEQQSRAFESFYQADLSITKRYQGVGLGLTIVQRLMDLMQGTVSLRSIPQMERARKMDQGMTLSSVDHSASGSTPGTEVLCTIPLEYGVACAVS